MQIILNDLQKIAFLLEFPCFLVLEIMQELHPTEFPQEHLYYRTSSPNYRKYLEDYGATTIPMNGGKQFWWRKWPKSWFQIIKFEKIDEEPDIEMLRKKYGVRHAWIIWIPATRTDIPTWWKILWMTSHYVTTWIALLEPEYWKRWSERSRRARNKYKKMNVEIKQVEPYEFVEGFKITPTKHPFKKDYIKFYTHITQINPLNIRNYVAYYDGKIVAGLAVHDYNDGKSSVHLVAYTNRKYYHTQAWTGLIDRWYEDSLKMGVKFIDYDRLREKFGPADQKGYTEFKENFIHYKFNFKKSYFKFI